MNKISKTFLSLVMAGVLISTTSLTFGTKVKADGSSSNRIWGSNRYETAIEIAKAGWTSSDTVILACGENYPDALCAGPLAHVYNAPVLLTPHDKLNADTEAEIKTLNAKTVYLVGGEGVLFPAIESELKDTDKLTVNRISGNNRYDTSVKVAKEVENKLGTNCTDFDVASGSSFADALSVSPYASYNNTPILLTPVDQLSNEVTTYLNGKKGLNSISIVGGTGVVSQNVQDQLANYVPSKNNVSRYAGQNRYETNATIIKAFGNAMVTNAKSSNVLISTGTGATEHGVFGTIPGGYADALVGSSYAAKIGAPLIITDGTLTADQKEAISDIYSDTTNVTIEGLGGTGALSDDVINQTTTLLTSDLPMITSVFLNDFDGKTTIPSAVIEEATAANQNGSITITIPSSVSKIKDGSVNLKADLSKATLFNGANLNTPLVTQSNISKTDNLYTLVANLLKENGYNPDDGILKENIKTYLDGTRLELTGTNSKVNNYIIHIVLQ